MSSNNGYITIQEASVFSGLAISTLYKAVQKGILPVEYSIIHGKNVKKIRKSDIIRVFNISDSTILHSTTPSITPDITQYNTIEYDRISDIVQENIKKVLEEKQSQLIKPLEEHALVKYGAIRKENEFLQQRLETLFQENEFLREQVKVLPDFQKEKETYKSQVELLEKEKAEILSKAESIQREKEEQIRKTEGLNQVLLDNANNLKELAGEKARIEIQLKEQNSTIKEKEHSLKELHELHRLEIERLKEEAEEREKQIAEAWKKELEEARRPWWKKLW